MFLTSAEIRNAQPEDWTDDSRPLERARRRMRRTDQWSSEQCMGRRWPIGCVALEVTQRCNLDCGACYLSENSEAVKDLPLDEVFRRIDLIRRHYGRDTDVQVTGGDPTLRKRSELIAIVRRIRALDMRPALFTNGIRATRDLLQELAEAGLVDVAFHVDMTQRRRGYGSEQALDALRAEYIARTRGLPLAVYFNTTVFDGNLADVPALARFFVRNSDAVRLASFQIQAEVGRGVPRRRGVVITPDAVCERIQEGIGTSLTFDALQPGHARCNRYAAGLVANGSIYDLLDDKRLVSWVLSRSARVQFDRQKRRRVLASVAEWLMRNPDMLPPISAWLVRKAWAARNDLWRARGRVNKLSFFVHNFKIGRASCRERV